MQRRTWQDGRNKRSRTTGRSRPTYGTTEERWAECTNAQVSDPPDKPDNRSFKASTNPTQNEIACLDVWVKDNNTNRSDAIRQPTGPGGFAGAARGCRP